MFKVSTKELAEFVQGFHSGNYPNQRLGQAFYNEFMPRQYQPNMIQVEELNKLFYGEDYSEVMDIILNDYVRWWEDLGK